MENFDNIPVYSGEPKEMEFQIQPVSTSVTAIEQSRAVAETQAAMIVAQKFPRNENQAYNKIMTACQRKSLAASSSYAFKRGTQLVTGPSIRLAEVLARCWGNTAYGFREINRNGDQSEVEAFCWDMETNVRVTRTFAVKHYRDKKTGVEKLTSERDKYEHIASQAQRRVRACILEMIPGDFIEAAEDQCRKTIEKGDGKPIEDRVRDMIVAFKDFGVTEEMIESFLSHKVKAIVPAELVRLQQVYRSIKDGVATREEFFEVGSRKEPKKQKQEEPNPLHSTPAYRDFVESRDLFPEHAVGMSPKTEQECLECVATIKKRVDEEVK